MARGLAVSTLVIHPGPLGDLLLAVPALRALRRLPGGEPLELAARPSLGALLVALGVADGWRDAEALGLGTLFVGEDVPRVPALEGRSRVVSWFGARDPVYVRRLRTVAPGAIVASPTGDGTLPVWTHLLRSVGAPAGAWQEPLSVPEPLAEAGRRALEAAGWDGGRPLALVHPGAGSRDKRWPAEAFAEVLGRLAGRGPLRVVVHQGPADADAVQALGRHLGCAVPVLREAPLDVLAGALAHADAYLGNDSGPSHLAAALGVPGVVVFQAHRLSWRPWWAGARPVVATTAAVVGSEVAAVTGRLAEALADARTRVPAPPGARA
jgi:hypothetical protein